MFVYIQFLTLLLIYKKKFRLYYIHSILQHCLISNFQYVSILTKSNHSVVIDRHGTVCLPVWMQVLRHERLPILSSKEHLQTPQQIDALQSTLLSQAQGALVVGDLLLSPLHPLERGQTGLDGRPGQVQRNKMHVLVQNDANLPSRKKNQPLKVLTDLIEEKTNK
jgi:hypothetical protein